MKLNELRYASSNTPEDSHERSPWGSASQRSAVKKQNKPRSAFKGPSRRGQESVGHLPNYSIPAFPSSKPPSTASPRPARQVRGPATGLVPPRSGPSRPRSRSAWLDGHGSMKCRRKSDGDGRSREGCWLRKEGTKSVQLSRGRQRRRAERPTLKVEERVLKVQVMRGRHKPL
jgi:hypothetical protein